MYVKVVPRESFVSCNCEALAVVVDEFEFVVVNFRLDEGLAI